MVSATADHSLALVSPPPLDHKPAIKNDPIPISLFFKANPFQPYFCFPRYQSASIWSKYLSIRLGDEWLSHSKATQNSYVKKPMNSVCCFSNWPILTFAFAILTIFGFFALIILTFLGSFRFFNDDFIITSLFLLLWRYFFLLSSISSAIVGSLAFSTLRFYTFGDFL
jgi:hypothetical protein